MKNSVEKVLSFTIIALAGVALYTAGCYDTISSASDNISIAKRFLKRCQAGNFESLSTLQFMIQGGQVSYEQLGIGLKDIVIFLHQAKVKEAKHILLLAKEGSYEKVDELWNLIKKEVSFEELGITADEIKRLQRQPKIEEAKRILILCRVGFVEGAQTLLEFNKVGISFEEIGSTTNEIKRFLQQPNIEKAKNFLKLCQLGFLNGNIESLKKLIAEGVTYEELGITKETFDNLVHETKLAETKKYLRMCRFGYTGGNALKLRELIQKGITYGELGATKEEVEGFKDP